MATIDTDTLQQLAETLTATGRLQDGAALAATGLVLPLARVRTRSARRELTRVRLREGDKAEAARRQQALVAALATRERSVSEQLARRSGPQAEPGEGEAALAGRITRDGAPLVDVEVVALDAKLAPARRTCTGRDGRYALAIPADADLLFEVREGGKPKHRDKVATAFPAGYRGWRDIELGRSDPVCDPAAPPAGEEQLQMPALVGLPLERALAAVEALGLGEVKVKERVGEPGIVLAQEPAAGARVAPRAGVALSVGRADERVAANLGELRGKTLGEALDAMAGSDVGVASVTIVAGKGRQAVVRDARVAGAGEALHLDVAAGGEPVTEVDIAAALIGASPEGQAIGLASGAEAARWLAAAQIGSLADLVEAAGEDDAVLRRRLALDGRARVAGPRRALLAAASRIRRA